MATYFSLWQVLFLLLVFFRLIFINVKNESNEYSHTVFWQLTGEVAMERVGGDGVDE